MTHIFISYAHDDRAFVERLTADLQAAKVDIWIDKIGLKPGTPDWEQALRDAIRTAKAVLLIASPASRRSPYVRDELAIAEMEGKLAYPVWADGQHWMDCIPIGRGYTQYIDARGETYQRGVKEVVKALSGAVQVIVEPTVLPSTAEPRDAATVTEPRNPYKGLRPFHAADRGDFFGRETLVNKLTEALQERKNQPRFLAVVGPSGSGKSSVVMAGLLPNLQDGALSGSQEWIYLDPFVPGVHPLENLTIALSKYLKEKAQKTIREDLEDKTTRGLHTLARQITGGLDQRVVLYVDQFEELFTLTTSETERRQFIDLLATAVSDPGGPVVGILSLRADFTDHLMNYAELGRLLEEHGKFVLPMTLADLYEAVQNPAVKVGLTFDEGLVTDLVFAVRDQAGALPLLQFTLDQLFERREDRRLTRKAYDELGGVQGALAQHAEATYSSLPSDEHRRLARALFLRLIEPGETERETTRHRAAMSELELPNPDETRVLRETANTFINARLLVTDQMTGGTTIEVSHEALIREWKHLGGWLHDAREDLRLQKAISADTAEWRRRGSKPDDDILYRGTVLGDAQAWATRNAVSVDEIAFITASVEIETQRIEEERKIARRVRNFQRMAVGSGLILTAMLAALVILSVLDLLRGNEQLAFVSDKDGDLDIYVMNAGPSLLLRLIGGAPRDLSQHSADDYAPEWSPDGSRIAFVSVRDGNPEIYVMNADGSNPFRLTFDEAVDTNPTWSPDGTQLAFQSDRVNTPRNPGTAPGGVQQEANYDIYVMDVVVDAGGASPSNPRQITFDTANDEFPAWSPDGRQIVFQSDRVGADFDIYLMEADGMLVRNLTDDSQVNDLFPTWTRDGRQIAFVSTRPRSDLLSDPTRALTTVLSEGNYEIYVMDTDGSNRRQITNSANDESPNWSPDGTRIAFTSDRDGDWKIYVMDANGNNVTPLIDFPGQDPVFRNF